MPFDLVHLNERSEEITRISDGRTPRVIAHTADRSVIVLDSEALDPVGGDVDRFAAALRAAPDAAGVRWSR